MIWKSSVRRCFKSGPKIVTWLSLVTDDFYSRLTFVTAWFGKRRFSCLVTEIIKTLTFSFRTLNEGSTASGWKSIVQCFGVSTLRKKMKIFTFSIRTVNEGSTASGWKSIVQCFGVSTLRKEMKIFTFSIRIVNEGSLANGLKSIVFDQNYCFGNSTLRKKMKIFTLSIWTAN